MACSEEAAFQQTAPAHYIPNISSQCHNSLVDAARQIANSLSPIAKKILTSFLRFTHNIIRKNF